ncbi:uncharacterized protein LACBIDRAFT_322926 [Laccaria bicolor S238N-H82]|uniref:Predicted protein n=1 Tax=Laccaria bicolor (strain S238N-H82 / ATCC MYA-4686) TaxID=486041 RepID=B0CVL0_LACBS|nr:uncharacterized protein LACBIDRAFT_322926 [Laccaria bicolor S238N-H82]EDR13763.1 predicted protein [Laccaria bicolor S238N-H82]|eukprot:XP_001876261.1 predicted protein [Laccaria bicolor S238N-H82]
MSELTEYIFRQPLSRELSFLGLARSPTTFEKDRSFNPVRCQMPIVRSTATNDTAVVRTHAHTQIPIVLLSRERISIQTAPTHQHLNQSGLELQHHIALRRQRRVHQLLTLLSLLILLLQSRTTPPKPRLPSTRLCFFFAIKPDPKAYRALVALRSLAKVDPHGLSPRTTDVGMEWEALR